MAGALEEMMKNDGRSMFIVICIVLGGLIGELIDIEGWFERFGKWLKIKSGNAKDPMFVEGFVTASLTVCIGAMAVVGAIEDGIHGDFSILATKAVLDLVLVMIMSGYMGIGCVFSALPVAVFEGLMTIFAMLMKSVMITSALSDLSLIGSILIFCVGVNLVWDKRVRVAIADPGGHLCVCSCHMKSSIVHRPMLLLFFRWKKPRDKVETNKMPSAITAAVLKVVMPVLSAPSRSLWTMASIV